MKYSDLATANKRIQQLEKQLNQFQQQQTRQAALAELSKPEYNLIDPTQFLELHSDKITADELGVFARWDGKEGSLQQFVKAQKANPRMANQFVDGQKTGGYGQNSAQGGQNGQSAPIPANVKNPWKKETFNLTEQGQIFSRDPALAERLKQQAQGVTA